MMMLLHIVRYKLTTSSTSGSLVLSQTTSSLALNQSCQKPRFGPNNQQVHTCTDNQQPFCSTDKHSRYGSRQSTASVLSQTIRTSSPVQREREQQFESINILVFLFSRTKDQIILNKQWLRTRARYTQSAARLVIITFNKNSSLPLNILRQKLCCKYLLPQPQQEKT